MLSPAKRARIVRLGAWLILVLALMPNISYMGHWPEMAGTADDHHDDAALPGAPDAAAEEHAAHCHVGPAHCGGGESMIGTPFVGDDTGGLVLPRQESKGEARHMFAALSAQTAPLLQPPRSA